MSTRAVATSEKEDGRHSLPHMKATRKLWQLTQSSIGFAIGAS